MLNPAVNIGKFSQQRKTKHTWFLTCKVRDPCALLQLPARIAAWFNLILACKMAPAPDDVIGHVVDTQLLGHLTVTLFEYCAPPCNTVIPVTEPELFTMQVPARPEPPPIKGSNINIVELLAPSPGL